MGDDGFIMSVSCKYKPTRQEIIESDTDMGRHLRELCAAKVRFKLICKKNPLQNRYGATLWQVFITIRRSGKHYTAAVLKGLLW